MPDSHLSVTVDGCIVFKSMLGCVILQTYDRERSGSVVECLTRDRGAAGSSLTGVTALCPWARTLIQEDPSLYNWKIVDGT